MSYSGCVEVVYPLSKGDLVLRSECDWSSDIEPSWVDRKLRRFRFDLAHERPYLAFKPCIRLGDDLHWSEGPNKLALLSTQRRHRIYPRFQSGSKGALTPVRIIPSTILDRDHRVRVYIPAGYGENRLKSYPVLYMHDGRNLFLPQEAFEGKEWRVDENLEMLDSMNLIDQVIVVGLHAGDREREYTSPGYESYGRALVEEIKPWIDLNFRTLPQRRWTGIMGSSLGGVVTLFVAWQWPEIFANASCLSSTFGYQDDLLKRVEEADISRRRHLRIYLDSGWPGDNYEATLSMALALIERGFRLGNNLFHFAFPNAAHDESAWSARFHLPLQLFASKLRRAYLGTLPQA